MSALQFSANPSLRSYAGRCAGRAFLMSSSLSISKIGPESDVLLRNLFQLYIHDMAEWFEIDTNSDGSYSYDTSLVWEKGYDAYLAKVGDSIAGFALVGPAVEWLGESGAYDVHEFFVTRRFRRRGFGQTIATLLWNERPGEWLVRASRQMRQPPPSGETRFRVTRVVHMKRKGAWSTGVHGDSSGSHPMAPLPQRFRYDPGILGNKCPLVGSSRVEPLPIGSP